MELPYVPAVTIDGQDWPRVHVDTRLGTHFVLVDADPRDYAAHLEKLKVNKTDIAKKNILISANVGEESSGAEYITGAVCRGDDVVI
ncbi:MAG TPA: hypothetical protein VLE73_02110 [Candidatus Saccharimonadales bacterium]|nr:hypothetical protein [Candidatus Saccharimonadales bacterium]